jgi:hypothetical protein
MLRSAYEWKILSRNIKLHVHTLQQIYAHTVYIYIIPMLFVTVVLSGQKQNWKRIYTSINLNIHMRLKSVTSLNYHSPNITAILIFNKLLQLVKDMMPLFTNLQKKKTSVTSPCFIVTFHNCVCCFAGNGSNNVVQGSYSNVWNCVHTVRKLELYELNILFEGFIDM